MVYGYARATRKHVMQIIKYNKRVKDFNLYFYWYIDQGPSKVVHNRYCSASKKMETCMACNCSTELWWTDSALRCWPRVMCLILYQHPMTCSCLLIPGTFILFVLHKVLYYTESFSKSHLQKVYKISEISENLSLQRFSAIRYCVF